MDSLLTERVNASTEYEQGKRYLVLELKAPKEEVIYTYQLDMLDQNPSGQLLPVEMRIKNKSVAFYYDITGLNSIEEYLRKRKISARQFLDLTYSLASAVNNSLSLLLNAEGFVLDNSCVFIEPVRFEPQLVYLPVRLDRSLNVLLGQFLCGMAGYVDNAPDDAGRLKVQAVLRLLKTSDYGMEDLIRLCGEPGTDTAYGLQRSDGVNPLLVGKKTDSPGAGDDSEPKKTDNRVFIDFNTKIAGASIKAITAGIGAQLLILAAAALSESIMKKNAVPVNTRYVLISTAVVVLDLIIFKYLMPLLGRPAKPENPGNKQVQVSPDAVLKESSGYAVSSAKAGFCEIGPGSKDSTKKAQPAVDRSKSADIGAPPSADMNLPHEMEPAERECNETMFLEQPASLPVLIPLDSSSWPQGELDGDTYIVGRNRDIANLVLSDKVIGRVHAEIIKSGSTYEIIDRSSRNGTYVNGLRLAPGQRLELEDNDEVAFANISYKFVLPYMPK